MYLDFQVCSNPSNSYFVDNAFKFLGKQHIRLIFFEQFLDHWLQYFIHVKVLIIQVLWFGDYPRNEAECIKSILANDYQVECLKMSFCSKVSQYFVSRCTALQELVILDEFLYKGYFTKFVKTLKFQHLSVIRLVCIPMEFYFAHFEYVLLNSVICPNLKRFEWCLSHINLSQSQMKISNKFCCGLKKLLHFCVLVLGQVVLKYCCHDAVLPL